MPYEKGRPLGVTRGCNPAARQAQSSPLSTPPLELDLLERRGAGARPRRRHRSDKQPAPSRRRPQSRSTCNVTWKSCFILRSTWQRDVDDNLVRATVPDRATGFRPLFCGVDRNRFYSFVRTLRANIPLTGSGMSGVSPVHLKYLSTLFWIRETP